MLAATAIVLAVCGLCVVIFWREHLLGDRLRWLSERLEILSRSITALSRRMIVAVGAMTVVIWSLEMLAVAFVMRGFGVVVGLAALGLIYGSATFSTLIPSAPGYVGSLQAAFVLAFSALGLEPVLGLLSATATQLVLLGPLTIVGLLLLLSGHVHGAVSLITRGTVSRADKLVKVKGMEVSYEGRDLEVLTSMPNYYAWIMETFAPYVRGDIVEYGAGRGTVSERLLAYSDKLILVEPSANLVEILQTRFAGDPRVEIVPENLERHAAGMKAATVDTAILVNVLEHIEDDKSALRHLTRMLRPGGHLLVSFRRFNP